MIYTFADQQKDATRAFEDARRYHAELGEIYKYFTPFRQPTIERADGLQGGNKSAGDRRTDVLFDGTAPSSAFAFVSNMKADWLPAFENFFALKNGPLFISNPEDAAKRTEKLEQISTAVHGLTQRIRATAADEMFADLFAGTGCLALNRGNVRVPIRGFSIPITEMAMEAGPFGDVDRRYWRRKWKSRHIEALFPGANIGTGLARTIRENRDADVTVTQYCYWSEDEAVWHLVVWTDKDTDKPLRVTQMLSSPFITPRFFVVPGEAMGRGLAHLALPFTKTVNKARELALRAAAFALLGLWTRTNDAQFNPATASMTPGAFWKVSRNGGPNGPTIQRLDVPKDFDISTVIINDERQQIRRVLLDDELPELADRVRSPTEIAGRMRRYERNRGGATTRLAFELITPFVERSVDILGEMRLLPGDLKVDDILTSAEVKAPAAAAQRTDRVDRVVSWLQIMLGLVGPQKMQLIAAVEDILPEIGRDLGISESFIRKKTEMEFLKATIDEHVQQAVEAERKSKAPAEAAPQAPAPEELEAAYVNGGGAF